MSQERATGLRDRQLIVRLKGHFDQERFQGPSVSTEDPAGRVAKALGIGKRVVKEIVSNYHQTGKIAPPELEYRGKPPYRIQPALETVIRHEIRRRNREGSHVSLANLFNWLENHYEKVPKATLGRALARMGFTFGKSRRRSALRERDDVLIARRTYLRTKLAKRSAGGGTIRPEVYLDEGYVNVNHSSERTWYFAEEGPWVQKPSGKGPRLILVHAMTAAGWVSGAKLGFGVEGESLFHHRDEQLGAMQLIVVGKFRQTTEEAVRHTREILTQNRGRLVPVWELAELIKEIGRTGKDFGAVAT